jgi:uncharacterized protein with beta-barrel porin domain
MNRTHRIVWSESRKAFIVTGENAKAKGKPSTTRKAIASAVVMALTALAAEPALAGACTPGTTITVTSAVTGCTLATGDALTVSSAGSIIANTYGVSLPSGVSASSITNSGTITGANNGINLTAGTITGALSNSGTITGTQNYGIDANSSTINSLTNSGSIKGGSSGIYVNGSTITGALSNSGTITGTASAGIDLYLSKVGSLTNSGTITGGGTGILLNHGTITGTLSNSGTITGTSGYGIELTSSSTINSLTNSGTITGRNTGIYVNASTITGALSNSGTITGGTSADGIKITGVSTVGSLSNSGTITGGIYSVYVASTSTLANLYLTGSSASLVGDVYAPNTAVSVTGTFTGTNAFDVKSFNVASGGVFNLGADSTMTGSTISGSGVTVGTGGFNNAGTLAIASGVTGKITGAYTQTSTTSNTGLNIGVASQSSFGKLSVTGAATFSGSGLIYIKVATPGTALSGTSLSSYVLTTTGGITASSGFTVKTNSTADTFTAKVVGNEIDVSYAAATTASTTSSSSSTTTTTTPPAFTTDVSSAGNTQSQAAANILDGLKSSYDSSGTTGNASMNAVIAKLESLSGSASSTSTAITSTLPLAAASTTQATAGVLHGVNQIVQARQDESHGLSSGEDFVTNRDVWVKPIGSWGNQNDTSTVSGYKSKTFGAAFGADGDLSPQSRLGVALSLTRSTVDNNLGTQSAAIESYQAVLYGSRALDDKNMLDWQGDYGLNQNTSSRNISFMSETAASSYASNSVHLGSSVGHRFNWTEQTSITPSIRADYTALHNNSYTETGANALNLIVDGSTSSEFVLGLDGKVAHKVGESANLSGNLGVGYNTMAQQSSITAAYQGGGAAFTTQGLAPAHTVLRGGVGMVIQASKTIDITGRYDVEARSGFTGQTGSVKFNMMF